MTIENGNLDRLTGNLVDGLLFYPKVLDTIESGGRTYEN